MPSSPKWKISRIPKVSSIEQLALRHAANSPSSTSIGFGELGQNSGKVVQFARQLPRKDLSCGAGCNPHESRFEPFDASPPILTSSKY